MLRRFRNSDRKHRLPRPQSAVARQLREQAVQRAKGARREAVVLGALVAAVLVAYHYRDRWFGIDLPVRIASAIILVLLGWAFARAVGRALGPMLLGRMESRTAGTVGFLVRLIAMAMTVLVSGNLAGELEGTVTSLGLLYTELEAGGDRTMVPNNVVLGSVIVPLREPTPVDVLARLRSDAKPSEIQALLDRAVTTPTRTGPEVGLEEVDSDEVVVRIFATPEDNEQGARLADEILAALGELTENGHQPV